MNCSVWGGCGAHVHGEDKLELGVGRTTSPLRLGRCSHQHRASQILFLFFKEWLRTGTIGFLSCHWRNLARGMIWIAATMWPSSYNMETVFCKLGRSVQGKTGLWARSTNQSCSWGQAQVLCFVEVCYCGHSAFCVDAGDWEKAKW